jgi:hypothetical protein
MNGDRLPAHMLRAKTGSQTITLCQVPILRGNEVLAWVHLALLVAGGCRQAVFGGPRMSDGRDIVLRVPTQTSTVPAPSVSCVK